jgi:RimJ/RimL family protein N-acetyltransferase
VRKTVASLLKDQGKVKGVLSTKADRCKLLCIVRKDGHPIGMGAIKEKTDADFGPSKADLPELSSAFESELGYFYTVDGHAGLGIASNVARLLLSKTGGENLMASTEVSANPAMVKILEKNGFRLFGKPWKSGIHGRHLGLFLRFASGD